jgi:hypothetical protein
MGVNKEYVQLTSKIKCLIPVRKGNHNPDQKSFKPLLIQRHKTFVFRAPNSNVVSIKSLFREMGG